MKMHSKTVVCIIRMMLLTPGKDRVSDPLWTQLRENNRKEVSVDKIPMYAELLASKPGLKLPSSRVGLGLDTSFKYLDINNEEVSKPTKKSSVVYIDLSYQVEDDLYIPFCEAWARTIVDYFHLKYKVSRYTHGVTVIERNFTETIFDAEPETAEQRDTENRPWDLI